MSIVKSFFQTLEFKFASEEKRKEVTNKRLHELVDYARKHSPFLAELYKDLKDDYKLEDIPIVNKKMIMENYDRWTTDPNVKLEELLAFTSDTNNIGKRYRNYLVCKTSGSTANYPLIMLHDQSFLNNTTAESLFLGTMSHKPIVFLNPLQLFVIPVCMVRDNIRRFPFIKKDFNLVSSLDPMDKIVSELNRIQPKALYTQPSIVELLADEQEAGRLHIDVKEIVCNSEILPEGTRKHLLKIFPGCKIESIYGCTELGNMAIECADRHHHLNSYWNIIEFMDENNRPIKEGEKSSKIIVTNLSNRVLPLIRYEMNDKLIYHADNSCPCGNKRPWIEIDGRNGDDFVYFYIDGEIRRLTLAGVFYNCTCIVEGLRSFQIAIHGYHDIEFRALYASGTDKDAANKQIKQILETFFAENKVEGFRVYTNELNPQQDQISRKVKSIFQDQIEK